MNTVIALAFTLILDIVFVSNTDLTVATDIVRLVISNIAVFGLVNHILSENVI